MTSSAKPPVYTGSLSIRPILMGWRHRRPGFEVRASVMAYEGTQDSVYIGGQHFLSGSAKEREQTVVLRATEWLDAELTRLNFDPEAEWTPIPYPSDPGMPPSLAANS